MPNYKNFNKNRNTSQKSNASSSSNSSGGTKPADDDDWGTSILKKTTSRNVTPKQMQPETVVPPLSIPDRPEFMEPLSPKSVSPPPPPTPWETLGMTETDYTAMMERVKKQMQEDMRKTYIDNMLAELNTPRYWLNRIVRLEKEREYFNKKRGWSAGDIIAVERIDEEIKECEAELDILYENADRLENEYD